MSAQITQRFAAIDRGSNGSHRVSLVYNAASNPNPNPIPLLPQSLLPTSARPIGSVPGRLSALVSSVHLSSARVHPPPTLEYPACPCTPDPGTPFPSSSPGTPNAIESTIRRDDQARAADLRSTPLPPHGAAQAHHSRRYCQEEGHPRAGRLPRRTLPRRQRLPRRARRLPLRRRPPLQPPPRQAPAQGTPFSSGASYS
jgi:hypothetical protein